MDSVQQAIKGQNKPIFKNENVQPNHQPRASIYYQTIKPTKMESIICFVSQFTLLVIIVPLFIALILISFHCLKIAIEIFKQN